MTLSLREIKLELRPMLVLAGPVILSELGWITMGVVDTIMVGRLGAVPLGAVSIGSILFFTATIFGMGLLFGLDTVVSQAFGAGRIDECHRWLVQGVYIAMTASLPLFGLLWISGYYLPRWGINSEIVPEALPYLHAISWSIFPVLVQTAFRRYLQAMNRVAPILFAMITANLINAGANWLLIYGHYGFPRMGTEGSGWATFISRVYLMAVLVVYTVGYAARRQDGLLSVSLQPQISRIRRLIGLGLPAAGQVTLEIGVFAVATTLAGRLQPVSLAAHQIALNIASFAFMVPYGIASAGAVRVGQAIGRRDAAGASRSGWTAMLLGAGFMACAALVFLIWPRSLLRIFTTDLSVIRAGVPLLFVAALFQLFDGLQSTTTGALRGAGDTRTPMICNLVGHWVVGLPTGYFLCFVMGWNVVGLWSGLATGLTFCGIVLVGVWSRRVKRITAALGP
ncbi:MAG: MATE family efflux transporter [Acidobacteriota bacterium]